MFQYYFTTSNKNKLVLSGTEFFIMLCRFSANRNVYERGDRSLQNPEMKEERLLLLQSWKDFEVLTH